MWQPILVVKKKITIKDSKGMYPFQTRAQINSGSQIISFFGGYSLSKSTWVGQQLVVSRTKRWANKNKLFDNVTDDLTLEFEPHVAQKRGEVENSCSGRKGWLRGRAGFISRVKQVQHFKAVLSSWQRKNGAKSALRVAVTKMHQYTPSLKNAIKLGGT